MTPPLPKLIKGRTVKSAAWFTPAEFAETVTSVGKSTGSVDTLKLAVADPAATTTLDGTIAARKSLLVRETATPPAGAGPLNVTVPIEDRPPATLEGLNVTEVRTGARTRRGALTVTPLTDAEIVAQADVETGVVVTVNVPLFAPAGIVTNVGKLAAEGLLLARETDTPLAGAGPLNVTTPVDELPPVTLVGLRPSEEMDSEEPEEEVTVP